MSDAAVVQMLESGQEDLRWFEANAQSIRKKFDNQFIAFSNREVIDADTNLDILMEKLKTKNVDTSKVFVRFVSKIKTIL